MHSSFVVVSLFPNIVFVNDTWVHIYSIITSVRINFYTGFLSNINYVIFLLGFSAEAWSMQHTADVFNLLKSEFSKDLHRKALLCKNFLHYKFPLIYKCHIILSLNLKFSISSCLCDSSVSRFENNILITRDFDIRNIDQRALPYHCHRESQIVAFLKKNNCRNCHFLKLKHRHLFNLLAPEFYI